MPPEKLIPLLMIPIMLVVVLLIFGTKRLRGAGRDLGEAVKGFKKGISDDDKPVGERDDQAARREDQTVAATWPG